MSDDKIKIGVDGPGIDPKTVDPLEALRVATAYFELVQRIATHFSLPLEFKGIEVEGGSAGLASRSSEPNARRLVEGRAISYVTGEVRPPEPLRPNVETVKRVIRALPKDHFAKVYDIGTGRPLLPAEFPLPKPPIELTTVRALLISLGGVKPKAKFTTDLENGGEPFGLIVTQEMARRLGQHLYSQIEISAEVERDSDDRIVGGEVLEFEPVASGKALEIWSAWHRENASDWDQIDDIEGELGRDQH